MRIVFAAFLAISCAVPPPSDTGAIPGAMTAQGAQACCDYVVSNSGKTMATKYLSCCLALLATACPPNQPPRPPQPDVSTGGAMSTGGAGPDLPICVRACNNLKALGCPESQSTCVALCNLHSTDDRFTQNLDCRVNAKTKTEAQKCGVASCR